MTAPIVELEMFLDVSCPWCHGALETNRRVLDELAADPNVPTLRLIWRFMRLHPMPSDQPLSLDAYYGSWGDESPEALERARDQVREYVRGVGVRVDYSRYDTLRDPRTAHRLLAAVRDDERLELPSLWSVARAVFNANFVHGVDITDHAALRGAVERAGLRLPSSVWERLARPADDDAAPRVDHARALDVQLDGVPRIVVNGEAIVPTWVDPVDVRARLREAIAAA